ncbi:hypothetical protein SDC9_33259 [bioreactor metagenome]|uniref:Uncharacterized protein n=1 Tax=bioreactor metagenome TaxID=1076179 RepID=A0A644V7C9_9ZZZZ|nr:hypothetical protein [Candidatus Elulimicrobiales bacterium]
MKIKKNIKTITSALFVFFLSTNFSFAQDATQNFKQTADNLTNNVLSSMGTLLMTAAFMFFFYGVVVFIMGRVTNKGDLKDIEKGKQFMLWGLIALFVMVSVWGIIRLAQDMLDVKGSDIQIKPVQFTPMASGGGGGSLGANNPLSGGAGSSGANDGKFTKSEGAACVGLAGSDSECMKGMFCRDSSNSPVRAGESGTCQTVDLNKKYKRLIDYANANISDNSSKSIRVDKERGILYITGNISAGDPSEAKSKYDQMWKIYGELDPNFKSNDVVLNVKI